MKGNNAMNLLASMTFWQTIVCVVFILVCILLILVVLLQKGRGGGLSGAFGGVGGHSAFGAKTGDVFTWVTVGLTFAFVFFAVVGNWVFEPTSSKEVVTPSVAPTDEGETPPAEDAGETSTESPAEAPDATE
jgi:preprotein translocase subunit SecG